MTIPFLIDFQPYSFTGEQCQSIDDMVSISLVQQFPQSVINYEIGSTDDVNIPLSIKNLTNNTKLEVEILFNANVFIADDNPTINKITATLEPGQLRIVEWVLNTRSLDQAISKFNTNIVVTVKNIMNGTIVTRNVPVASLPTRYLDETIL